MAPLPRTIHKDRIHSPCTIQCHVLPRLGLFSQEHVPYPAHCLCRRNAVCHGLPCARLQLCVSNVIAGISSLFAGAIAKRIGLINTMVRWWL